MTRARELANFADDTAGLETLTVSDITDLTATATEINKIDGYTGDHNDLNKIHAFTGTTADLEYAKDLRATGVTTTEFDKLDGLTASASGINSTVSQITDSSTDLNVDSNTLVVDKSANAVGIGTTAPEHIFHIADVGANSFNTKAVFDLEGTRRSGYTQATLELAPASSGGTFRPYAIAAELIGTQASSELVFYDNTTERMRINSGGNVDIGGASHAARRFSIKGTANDNSENTIEVLNSDSTTIFKLLSDGNLQIPAGNVGIGGTPSQRLEVKNTGSAYTCVVQTGANGVAGEDREFGAFHIKNNHSSASGAKVVIEGFRDGGNTDAGMRLNTTASGSEVVRVTIKGNGHVLPGANNTQDLGSSSLRWANIYSYDLHLSNEDSDGNSVDGTTGDWTIQEGSKDLFLINNKLGKKYKFKIEEV